MPRPLRSNGESGTPMCIDAIESEPKRALMPDFECIDRHLAQL